MIGFVNIYKDSGCGSTYAVGKVKRKLNVKCGHMGTLDPLASGVLPVGIGKATRLFDFLLDKQKTYLAEFEFGRLTDTLDSQGTTLQSGGRIPEESEIMRVLGGFLGEIDQIPPQYSAKNVAGKRGYELARQGVEFTLAPKRVKIYGVELTGKTAENRFSFRIDCVGGTYIRALGRDIGERLGTFATMTSLERVKSGNFTKENSVSLSEFCESDFPEKFITPADEAVSFEKLFLTEKQANDLLHGIYRTYDFKDGLYRVYFKDEFWGVGQAEGGALKMRAYCREV